MALAPNMALGGIVGAGLLAWIGADAALFVNAATFALGAGIVATARGLPRYDGEDEVQEHWRARFRSGIAYMRRNRTVLVLIVAQGGAMVFFCLTEPIEVAYTRGALGAGPGGYGALIAAWGAGVMVGSILYTWLGTKRLAVTAMLATLVQGAAYVGLGASPNIEVACAISVFGGAANSAQLAATGTAIQEAIALDFQARVMSIYEAMMTASPGVGYMLGGVIGAAFGGRAAFTVAGCGTLVVLLSAVLARPYGVGVRAARQPEASSA
jgi:MFS family permease